MEGIRPGTVLGNYTVVKATGKGSFSQVYVATHNRTGINVALKVILAKSLDEPLQKVMVENEIGLFKKIDFPLIAEYYESFFDKEFFVVSIEFVENGSLLSYINKFGKLNEDEARHYFIQFLTALEYLQAKCRIAHRDIKAENVLIDRNHNIRLIDFGFSHNMMNKKPIISGPCGTPAYAAPEVLKNQPFSPLSDVWSAGVFLYALSTGHLPFVDNNIQRLMQKIVYTEPKFKTPISNELKDLILNCLKKSVAQRYTLQEIWSHPWVAKYQGLKELGKLNLYSRLPLARDILAEIGSKSGCLEDEVKNSVTSEAAVEYRILKRNNQTDEIQPFSRWLKAETLHTNEAGDMPSDEHDPIKISPRANSVHSSSSSPSSSPTPSPIPSPKEKPQLDDAVSRKSPRPRIASKDSIPKLPGNYPVPRLSRDHNTSAKPVPPFSISNPLSVQKHLQSPTRSQSDAKLLPTQAPVSGSTSASSLLSSSTGPSTPTSSEAHVFGSAPLTREQQLRKLQEQKSAINKKRTRAASLAYNVH